MAPSITNYQEIQKDEIEALKSIYTDDFSLEHGKRGVWNKTPECAFQIRLKARSDSQDVPSITLQTSLPATYPKSAPALQIQFGDHVDSRTKKKAEYVIRQLPGTLLGSEMIYDITAALQDILDQVSTTNANDGPTLDEERNANEQNAKEKHLAQEAREKLEALHLAKQQEADHERQLLLQLEEQQKARVERRSAALSLSTTIENDEDRLAGDFVFERPSVKVRDPAGKVFSVKEVFRPLLFQQNKAYRMYLVSTDKELERECDNTFLCVKQYTLDEVDPSFRKRLRGLEEMLEEEMHSSSHANIAKPLNYSIRRLDPNSSAQWMVSILAYFTAKSSLRELLRIVEGLDARRTKAWSIQLLEGLHHYHQQGVAHGVVNTANILLWESESMTTTVKWSDGRYATQLRSMIGSTRRSFPSDWQPPETKDQQSDDVSLSADVWFFGICVLQMAFGLTVVQRFETPTEAMRELNLSQGLKSIFQSIFMAESKKRSSAWDLLHSEFLRNNEPLCIEDDISNVVTKQRQRRESEAPTEMSEYARKFVEEGRLGRGGFGEVFRARNRTDGQVYAVKKIKANSRSALNPVLSETTVLSRLNHPHVVRYFSSWIEEETSGVDIDASQTEDSEPETVSSNEFTFNQSIAYSSRGLDFISSDHVIFGIAETSDGDDEAESGDDASDCRLKPAKRDVEPILKTRSSSGLSGEPDYYERQSSASTQRVTLYIQMEYCKQETLRNLINSGIQGNIADIWRVLRQVVLGCTYIKPLNLL